MVSITMTGDHDRPEWLIRINGIRNVASEPVQIPEHERVARLQRLKAGEQAGTGVVPPGSEVLVDALGPDAGGEQAIALWREGLAAVALETRA